MPAVGECSPARNDTDKHEKMLARDEAAPPADWAEAPAIVARHYRTTALQLRWDLSIRLLNSGLGRGELSRLAVLPVLGCVLYGSYGRAVVRYEGCAEAVALRIRGMVEEACGIRVNESSRILIPSRRGGFVI